MLFRDDYAVLAPAAAVVALGGLFPYPFIDAEGLEELVVQVFRHGFAHDLAYDDRHQVGDDLVVRRKQSVLTGEAGGRDDEGLRWDVLHHETPRNSLVNPDKSCLPSAAQK